MNKVNIRFPYYEDCPSHDEALERVRQVVREEGVEATIEVIRVEHSGDVEKLKFLGSPTIFINGRDIDPPAHPSYALACRAYQLDDGRISPLPSKAMILRALRAAK
jgi:hypothetical protein